MSFRPNAVEHHEAACGLQVHRLGAHQRGVHGAHSLANAFQCLPPRIRRRPGTQHRRGNPAGADQPHPRQPTGIRSPAPAVPRRRRCPSTAQQGGAVAVRTRRNGPHERTAAPQGCPVPGRHPVTSTPAPPPPPNLRRIENRAPPARRCAQSPAVVAKAQAGQQPHEAGEDPVPRHGAQHTRLRTRQHRQRQRSGGPGEEWCAGSRR